MKLVEMKGITKVFPGVIANDKIDFDLVAGEIHVLLGENGSGKSTLMSILAGFYRPEEGDILIRGEKVTFRSPADALRYGIGMVHQHFRLVDNFTVAENVVLGTDNGFWLKRHRLEEEVRRVAIEWGLRVDPSARVWQLSVGEKQRVEILKVLWRGAQILILDEPTAVLTPQEVRELFSNLRQLKDSGRAIVLITHKLQEVIEIADRVTVLKRGQKVATLPNQNLRPEELSWLMVGRDVVFHAHRPTPPGEEVVLELNNVSVLNERGYYGLQNVSFKLRAGEILGIAGVAGNGQKELAEVAAGLRTPQKGRIYLRGRDFTGRPVADFVTAGVSYIPEDRLGTGVVPNLDVVDNILLRRQHQPPWVGRFFVARHRLQQQAEELIKKFDVRLANLSYPVKILSGGNLQKLILAREISVEPQVIVAFYPIRGLDVGAANAVHHVLLEQRERGAGILLISEDLDEIFNLSDRIGVLYDGKLMGIYENDLVDLETVGLLMMGNRPVQLGVAEQ